MRFLFASTASIFASFLLTLQNAHATPYLRDDGLDVIEDNALANATLEIRQNCPVVCGYYNQLCCSAGQSCYTDSNNQAQCGGGSSGGPAAQADSGQWQMFTTTYVETDLITVTSTYSSMVAGVATAASPQGSGAACNVQMGYTVCGGTCCSPGEFCNTPGQCVGAAGTTVGAAAVPTNSAYIRPTSGTVATATVVGTATATAPFQTPVGTDGSAMTGIQATPANNGLSPGAIAGIVIGVLFGLLLLFLLLAFLCCRSIFDAIFGRRRKRTTETYIEEHHHHGGGSSGRPSQRRWFGVLPGRADRPPRKDSSGPGILGVAGVLGTLAVILGLKRRHDRRVAAEKSSYTGSSYTYSDYTTSESSASSDRRTRDSRRSRR